MTAPVFVDTNVLDYWQDGPDPTKQSRADDWIAHLARLRTARISFQVLQELYATLTRKLKPAFDAEDCGQIFGQVRVIDPSRRRIGGRIGVGVGKPSPPASRDGERPRSSV